MRLRRLDLTRFGHFTDFTLDFGAKEDGKPDLHIILGPNEAGKSTAFDGYLDLIFGIPARSKYNFLHDYQNMRVGGVLEIDGDLLELIRIKKQKGDLLTPSGEIANPARLLRALGSIDRNQYRAMFSLDDETIEAGGEDILASQGNLGELLFSAAAGLSDLGSVLERARSEAEAFHKARARKTELAEAKRVLQTLHEEIRDIDVSASAFRRLKDTKDTAAKLLAEAKTRRDDLLTQRARLEAMIECLPLLKTLRETNAELAEFAGYPPVPDSARDEAQSLKTRHVRAATELRQGRLRVEEESRLREALELDPAILGISDELTVLLDIPKSRAQTAEEDLPKRETALEDLEIELGGLAQDLGVEDPVAGLLPEPRLAQLEEIAGEHGEVKGQLAAAKKEASDAARKLDALSDRPAEQSPSVPDQDLDALLGELAPEERHSALAKSAEELEAAEASLTAALASLRPWAGDPSELRGLGLSEAEARRLAERWSALFEEQKTAIRELQEAQRAYDQLAARLEEFEKGDAAGIERQTRDAREARDRLWEEHSAELTAATAAKFHAGMMRDDALQEARLGFTEGLARLHELQLEVATKRGALESCKATSADTEDAMEGAKASLNEVLVGLGLPKTYDPRDLPTWQSRLAEAQKRQTEFETRQLRYGDATRKVDDAIERLQSALGPSVEALDLKELTKHARDALAETAKFKAEAAATQKRREEAKSEAERRAKDVERLSEKCSDLEVAWAREVSALPAALKPLDSFRWKLPTLRKLASKLADRDQLKRRIEAMQKDKDAFQKAVESLAERVGDPIDVGPLVMGERLRKRLQRSEQSEADRAASSKRIAKAEADAREAEDELAAIDARVEEQATHFEGIHEIHSVDDLLDALAKAETSVELSEKSKEQADRIVTRLGVSSLAEAEEILINRDALELEGQRAATATDLGAAEAEHDEKIGDMRAAHDGLERVGGDNAPARLEEKRQTLLLDLGERAKAALSLRLGILAAEHALAAYRDEHRSKMLADTEAAFNTLTGGRYQDLRTQADGRHEVLLALRQQDNRSITVDEMSKGTRFQLYLALRLAGYRQYASNGMTLPFVADDIMETFDNTRTAAALGLLKEIASRGQALYFTHHEHVVELAREVCGEGLTVHEFRS